MGEYGRRIKLKTLPLKAKISLRRGMQQHLLITIFVVESRLEVVGKYVPRKRAQIIELKRNVADPQIHISFMIIKLRLGWSTVKGITKYGEAT